MAALQSSLETTSRFCSRFRQIHAKNLPSTAKAPRMMGNSMPIVQKDQTDMVAAIDSEELLASTEYKHGY